MRFPQLPLKAVASLVVAGVLTVSAAAVSGLEPRPATQIPDSAYAPVVVDRAVTAPLGLAAATPDLRPLADPQPPTKLAERPQPTLPGSKVISVRVWPGAAHSISGLASFYCRAGSSPCSASHPDRSGFDAYAAAGPGLRAAIGPDWRGRIVSVNGIRVKLIDWCKCTGGSTGVEKLIDLYYDVFARTGSAVTIRW